MIEHQCIHESKASEQLTNDEKVDVDGVEDSNLYQVGEISKYRVVLVVTATVVELEKEDGGKKVLVEVSLPSQSEVKS